MDDARWLAGGLLGRMMRAAVLLLSVLLVGGCFGERSFPMVPAQLVRMPVHHNDGSGDNGLPTRQWTVEANAAAAPLLPAGDRHGLTQEDFRTHAGILNVYQYFGLDPRTLDSFWGNLRGLEQTSQVSSPPSLLDAKGHIRREAWAGFTDVEVPVGGGITLYGRLGTPTAEIGKGGSPPIPGSWIVFTHGLFGSLDGVDTVNQVEALRKAGHHVLAIEMRGHGETNCVHPEYTVSFGIEESSDFLAVADWLRKVHGATRVGLVSFSLTGYEALLTAWLNGSQPVTRFDGVPLLKGLPEREPAPAYNAGMFIVSPPVDLGAVADSFDKRYTLFEGPCRATFQGHIGERMALVEEIPTYSMWGWAASEFQRAGWDSTYNSWPALKADLMKFLDLRGADWSEGVRRMENIRVPVLILAAANDPLGTAQGVADLFGRVKNPNIGVVMLKGGGHMGFSALSADYYYSMMLNFFDPNRGPGAREVGPLAKGP